MKISPYTIIIFLFFISLLITVKNKSCLVITFIIFIIFILKNGIIESFKESDNPSIHVLLATMGKDSIFVILNSLKTQLKENDYLTIVFDGPKLPNMDKVKKMMLDFNCNTNVIVEQKNLGYWGHAIRNKYNKLEGDYVFHVDDDDDITPNAINIIKNNCKDKNTIYIFKMKNGNDLIWKTKEIIKNEIGTPMGLIPTHLNDTSIFTYKYGGDYEFYKKLEKDGNNIEYIDKVIYIV
jgi:hypothetical protein